MKQKLSTLNSISHSLPNGTAKLIWAGCAFEAAANAFEALQHVLDFHAFHQGTHALGVAVTAAVELHVLQDAIFDFKLDGLAAGALGLVSVSHN